MRYLVASTAGGTAFVETLEEAAAAAKDLPCDLGDRVACVDLDAESLVFVAATLVNGERVLRFLPASR